MIPPEAVPEPIEYRLHYNELGNFILGTMQQHPETKTYIVVSKKEYDNYFRHMFVNGQIKTIDTNPDYRVKLKKASTGQRVVKNHAGIVLEDNEVFNNNVEYYITTG